MKKSPKKSSPDKDHQFVEHDLSADQQDTVDTQEEKKTKKTQQGKKKTPEKKTTTKKVGKKKKIEKTEKEESKDHIEDQLAHIYQNQDGSMPDMTHFDRSRRMRFVRAFLTLTISVFLFLGVLWAGFFVFQPSSSFSEDNIIVTISGDEIVTVGEKVRYRIRYRNAQETPLSQVTISVRYPKGFVYESSTHETDDEQGTSWTIGTLGAEDSGFIDVFGSMYSDIGKEESLRVFFTYLPSNFSSEFQKVTTLTVQTKESSVGLAIEAPRQVAANSEVDLRFTISQPSDDLGLTGLALEIDPESGFLKKGSTPKSDQFDAYRWTIPLRAEETVVTVQGVFPADAEGEAILPVRLHGWRAGQNITDDGVVLDEQEVTLGLIQQDIQIQPVVNGASHSLSVQPGEPLITSVLIRNTSDATITNAQARLVFDAPSHNRRSILDWASVQDEADGNIVGEQVSPVMRRGSITWNKKQIPQLALLEPGDEVTIDVTLPIKSGDKTTLSAYEAFEAHVSAELQYQLHTKTDILASAPVTLTMNSDARFDVRVEEEDGVYDIGWVLENSFHPLSDIRIEADIFGDTLFVADALQVPAGEAIFDEANKKLSWTVPRMPESLDILPLQFQLKQTVENPSQTQLMSRVTVKAIDDITGQEIILVGDKISLE